MIDLLNEIPPPLPPKIAEDNPLSERTAGISFQCYCKDSYSIIKIILMMQVCSTQSACMATQALTVEAAATSFMP